MGAEQILHNYDVVLVQAGFWVSLAFVLVVSTYWPWWKTDVGWTIILEAVGLGLLLMPSTTGLEFGWNTSDLFWQWFVAICFTFVFVIMPWRAVVIWRRQRYDLPVHKPRKVRR